MKQVAVIAATTRQIDSATLGGLVFQTRPTTFFHLGGPPRTNRSELLWVSRTSYKHFGKMELRKYVIRSAWTIFGRSTLAAAGLTG